jgi:adenylate cyclase
MGISINTGEVVVGNIGSHKRMKYGVVGNPVNITSRIQDLTISGQILISEATYQVVGESLQIGGRLRVKVKGISEPITIYDVEGTASSS